MGWAGLCEALVGLGMVGAGHVLDWSWVAWAGLFWAFAGHGFGGEYG
jgi:hypothetical protein